MSANLFDGRKEAALIEQSLIPRVQAITKQRKNPPKLVSILVGSDSASRMFIDIKEKRARAIGMAFERKHYPDSFDPAKVVTFIREANEDKHVDGIIVQLPLPEQFERSRVLRAIDPFKDVDGLHPKNFGALIEGTPTFLPPAVLAVQRVLDTYSIDVKGVHVVMLGSGLLIGKPVGLWLLSHGATVTFCHEDTKNIPIKTQQADIIISATGVPNVLTQEMIAEGTLVIDFGGIMVDGKLVGDVSRDVQEKAAIVTPVPGGIGPLTVSFLLENTVAAAEKFIAERY